MAVKRLSFFNFFVVGILVLILSLTICILQKQQRIQQFAATDTGVPMSPPPGYSQLIFDDTFAGSTLNSSWVPQMADPGGMWCGSNGINCPYSFVGKPGQFNAEYGDPAEVVVNNGLTLNAERSTKFSGYSWKAGYVTTYNKFTFDKGYVQVRAKMPDSTTGAWAGIWFLEKGSKGEIDLQESGYTGCGENVVNQCLAVNLNTSGNSQKLYNTGVDLSAGYHTYGMEYVPGKSITMFFDGKQVVQYTSNIPTGSYNVILTETMAQNASSWHTLVGSSTPSPLSAYQIGEVQVWQQCTTNCFSPTPTGTSSSDGRMPVGDIPGWHQIFVDDFTKDAPVGSWATKDAGKVVYVGDHGGQWVVYPDGWKSTYTGNNVGYMPSQVLSVHNGVLDCYLHKVNGYPASANPSPVLQTGSQYQTYGRYSIRMKVVYDDNTNLTDYYSALLLWPKNDSDYRFAESDFPEGGLQNSKLCAYAHYGGSGSQDSFCTTTDKTQWHTYTQEWGPGYRKYSIDDTLIGTSTKNVWANPERWQLQIEDSGKTTGGSGHVLVDWVAIYSLANTSSQNAFSVTLCPHGLGSCGDSVNPGSKGNRIIGHKTRHLVLTLTDASGKQIAQQEGQVTYDDSSQTFQGTILVSHIPPGMYSVTVKMDGFVSKKIPSVSVVSGQMVTLPALSLVNGDLTGDDQLSILDYNAMMSCFGSKYTTGSCLKPATSQNPGADIDDDGVVDGVDYNLFLREFLNQNNR